MDIWNGYEQYSIFDYVSQPYKITKPVRLIELFGGVGTQAMALERLNIDFSHYKLVEFDKYAVASYNAIHGTEFETKDIKEVQATDLEVVDTDNNEYILTYSFPCTDLSVAGRGLGMSRDSGTRSSLLWEVERLLRECKELEGKTDSNNQTYGMPQVLLMENVIQVHSKSNENMSLFNEWLDFLKGLGYTSFWQDLNASNYGVPQNRNRCFCISILGDCTYKFPNTIPLEICMEELLEPEEDIKPKFIVSEEKQKIFLDNLIKQEHKVLSEIMDEKHE